jgi:serine/threonine protein kinase
MEHCAGGELFERISAKQRYTEKEAAYILRQVVAAVKCLHDNQIAHCDLKPDNLLFKEKNSDDGIKIIDFNLAKFVSPIQNINKQCGTIFYMAPEVFDNNFSIHCDMWSIGVIMYIMLFGTPPFGDNPNNYVAYRNRIKQGSFFYPDNLRGPNIHVSTTAKDLISKLLVKDPLRRLSALEALEHPWLSEELPLENLATLCVSDSMAAIRRRNRLETVLLLLIE